MLWEINESLLNKTDFRPTIDVAKEYVTIESCKAGFMMNQIEFLLLGSFFIITFLLFAYYYVKYQKLYKKER